MNKEKTLQIINRWKKKHDIKMYTPYIYFRGLDTSQLVVMKLEEMKKFKNEKNVAKIKFETSQLVRKKKKLTTKKSKYHQKFEDQFLISSNASLEEKAKVTGIPVHIIQKVYAKGVAAWKTGHRPGASAPSWGNSRVSSFLTLGCTAFSADASLLWKVYEMRKTKKRKAFFDQPIGCPESKLKKFRKNKNFPHFLFQS